MLHCDLTYNETRVKIVLFVGSYKSIRSSMRTYWDVHKHATLQNLTLYAAFFSKLQEGTKRKH